MWSGTRDTMVRRSVHSAETRARQQQRFAVSYLNELQRCGYAHLMPEDSALVRMLRAGRPEGGDLENALDALTQVLGRPRTAKRVGPHFTCAEANIIAWVLMASRHTDAAIVWLEEHAAGDTDDDLHGGSGFDAARYLTGGR